MILTSHIIVSGLLGTTTQNYFLAAVFGFASHYILDAIPHWDYLSPEFKTRVEIKDGSFIKEKKFWKEISKMAIDAIVGFILLFIFLENLNYASIIVVFIGVFFGVLPDALQFLYWMTKWQPIKWNSELQHFMHHSIHKKIKQGFWPGIAIQIATMGIVFLIMYKF